MIAEAVALHARRPWTERATPHVVALCRTAEQLEAVIDAGLPEVELDWMELVGLEKAVTRARAAGLFVTIATTRVQKPDLWIEGDTDFRMGGLTFRIVYADGARIAIDGRLAGQASIYNYGLIAGSILTGYGDDWLYNAEGARIRLADAQRLAAGLAQTLETNRFREIIMTRVTVPLGEDIGFLPGTEEEKMTPWMGALTVICLLGLNAYAKQLVHGLVDHRELAAQRRAGGQDRRQRFSLHEHRNQRADRTAAQPGIGARRAR